jgi:hypothetical protein
MVNYVDWIWILKGIREMKLIFILEEQSIECVDLIQVAHTKFLETLGCIRKFPDWVYKEIYAYKKKTLVEKQHRRLWRQNSLDWLKK